MKKVQAACCAAGCRRPLRKTRIREQAIRWRPGGRRSGPQKGVNVLQAYDSSSVPRPHGLSVPKRRARPIEPATGPRNRLGWRSLVALLVVLGGIPGGPMAGLAQRATGPTAGGSLGVQQDLPQHGRSQQVPGPPEIAPPSPLSKKQKKDLLKDNFEKMKRDADELAELAKSLQEDLNKSNENVLSLRVVDKADKIEKLAKKIKGVARGY